MLEQLTEEARAQQPWDIEAVKYYLLMRANNIIKQDSQNAFIICWILQGL